jgi:GntR family transcriptional regulator
MVFMDKKEMDLNRKVPIPLYYQLKEYIRQQIEEGVLAPGDLLPSERELSEKYGISRPTVRQALKELVYEGYLTREKGRGTFVARPKIDYSFIQHFTTFYEEMEEKGYVLKTQVLKKEVRKASKKLAQLLQIKEGEDFIYIERLRSIEGEPVVWVRNHVPYALCPGLLEEDLTDRSLYQLLAEKYNLVPKWAEIALEPTLADELDARLLQIDVGAPMFLMENVTYSEKEKPMDFFISRFRGDKGRVRVRVFR